MTERDRIAELDRTLEAGLARGKWNVSGVDPTIAPLIEIARDLFGMPRQAFRARLKRELVAGSTKPRARAPRAKRKPA